MKSCSHAPMVILRRPLYGWVCWMSIVGFTGQCVSPVLSAEDPAKVPAPAKAAESSSKKPNDGASPPQNDGEKAAPPELIQLFTDAANFQNNQAFDLAAEAWAKFLQKYPADSRAAEARYNLGMSQLQLANQPGEGQAEHFDHAVETLTLVTQGSNKSLTEEAWLNLGLAHYTWALNETEGEQKEERLRQCVEALSRYLSDFPDAGRKDQALFYLGECQYLRQDLPAALKSYAQLVEEFPGSGLVPDGLYALGVALEESQDFAGAEGAFKKFLDSQPDHTLVPEVMTRRAETMLQQKKFAEAAQEFELAAKKPDYLQADHALFRAAYSWASLDDFRRGAETFSQLVRDFSASPLAAEATIAAARSFYRVPDVEAAREWYKKAFLLEGSPQAIVLANEAAHWLNRDALQARRADEVLQRVESRLPLAKPTDYLVHLRLDRADAWYQDTDHKPKAVTEYEAIAKEFPEHYLTPRALYNAAHAYLEKGDFEKAREIANTPLPRGADQPVTPLEAELRSVAAESALQIKEFEQADKLFAELRETGPEAYRSYWGVRQALALNLANRHEAAIQILDEVFPSLQSTSHQAESLYVRGLCQLALGNAVDAEESLTKSLASDRRWKQADEALFALARVQRTTQSSAAARKTLADLLQEFPQSAVLDECHLRWADFAYADKVYREAVEHYQEVLEKWPSSSWVPFAYYGLGWSQLGLNEQSAARDSFASLMEKFPQHSLAGRARYARGVAGQRMGEYESARTDFDQFVTDHSTEEHADEALYLSSVCSTALKQSERAVASLQRLLKEYPKYHRTDRARYDLAWALKESGQGEQSLEQFQALAAMSPTSSLAVEALYHLAENDYVAAKYEDAAKRYVVLQSHPALADNPELGEKATYKLAWCDFQTGKFEQ
ncbi:MAG: tetratricopeptide repeat protein, partial [Planctomycetota bacterium]|nr:tetratricopeptide repeat protein [Planctomycetota bacterium]